MVWPSRGLLATNAWAAQSTSFCFMEKEKARRSGKKWILFTVLHPCSASKVQMCRNLCLMFFLGNCSFQCRATGLCVAFKRTKLIAPRDDMPHVKDACRVERLSQPPPLAAPVCSERFLPPFPVFFRHKDWNVCPKSRAVKWLVKKHATCLFSYNSIN